MVIGNIKFGTVFRQVLEPDRQISLITTLHTTSTGSERAMMFGYHYSTTTIVIKVIGHRSCDRQLMANNMPTASLAFIESTSFAAVFCFHGIKHFQWQIFKQMQICF